MLKERFNLKARSCETVLRVARAEILEQAGQSIDQHRMDAYAFYRSVISDQKAPLRLRLMAVEGIVKLFGLAKPERIEISGPSGGPIQTESKVALSKLTVDELAALKIAKLGLIRAGAEAQAESGQHYKAMSMESLRLTSN